MSPRWSLSRARLLGTGEEDEMVLPTVVLLVAAAVIVLGATTELVHAVRGRQQTPSAEPGVAVLAVLDELDPRPLLLWSGVAGLAVLAPGLVAGSTLTSGELGLAVLVLGMAGERGQYLTRLASTHRGTAGSTALVGAVTVLGGLVVGAG